jgi:lysophospholipase L1-like esterase
MYESPDGAKELDFVRYCLEFNDGRAPDLIAIGLGTNDVFTATDDTIEKRIDGVLGYYDTLIQCMRKAGTDTRIGLYLANPPTFSQDGFRGYIGAGRQTRWQYRRNQHRLVERLLSHYDGRAHEHIDLVPNHLNLDVVHGFPAGPSAANARSDEQVMRVYDGVHPTESGYGQIGDVIYSWIVNAAGHAGE